MIAVVVPAHNEEEHIAQCLRSLNMAAACPILAGEPVIIIVVLDECPDGTARIARGFARVRTVHSRARNVGAARAVGAQAALAAGARWLAFTDADSEVAPDWISQQLGLQADAVCGTVQVRDWGAHSDEVRARFQSFYQDCDGHRHIHGANLGITADAYHLSGGFLPLAAGEDVALVHQPAGPGSVDRVDCAARVTTSSRKHFRAPGGFGATLMQLSVRWRRRPHPEI